MRRAWGARAGPAEPQEEGGGGGQCRRRHGGCPRGARQRPAEMRCLLGAFLGF